MENGIMNIKCIEIRDNDMIERNSDVIKRITDKKKYSSDIMKRIANNIRYAAI